MFYLLTSLFWLSLAALLYSYVGYPALLWACIRLAQPRPQLGLRTEDARLPEIAVLITAHNAAPHLRQRLENLLDSDYPPDRLRIIVASDGSTDATPAIVQAYAAAGVTILDYPQRSGKAATLLKAVHEIRSDIVVLSDATTRLETDALRRIAIHFQDPAVGLVTGRVSMVDTQNQPVESLYWRCELRMRRWEAELGIMLGASGALYAVRRQLMVTPSRPIINDDLVLPMLVVLQHGCKFVYDERARAFAVSAGGLTAEFRRRCRIGAGAWQCLPTLITPLLRSGQLKIAVAFASHKLLRWCGPGLMLCLFVSNCLLATTPTYAILLAGQFTAYAFACLGLFLPAGGKLNQVARVAASFVVMNAALLVGLLWWLRSPRNVIWQPTHRPLTAVSLQDRSSTPRDGSSAA